MATAADQTEEGISFGPFTLRVRERLLTREGVRLELGGRALDILIALISTPNEVVSKKDLMARVWPDVTVEEGSLRFHMASLRKALGDGRGGARYITTLAGRGYCFVAPVSRVGSASDSARVATADFPHVNLPARLSRMLGRDEEVLKLSAQLTAWRFVTIVGAGGVGKTTVAVALAHRLEAAFAGSVLFVDLGTLSDPKLAAIAVASLLGLSVRSDDATPSLIAYLRDKRILLILDTCEHLIEAIAALVVGIVKAAPQVHILATSREALRVDGEHVYRLDALACPPEGGELTAAAVQKFSAAQLFMERAVASGAPLSISDREAPIVADICRKLDGVALAIELAARHVESYGLQQTAELLDERLTLLWQGSRNAPPRHKTLHATLDWSYGLLSELERTVLRRLAVFVGHFTLDAALAVVTSAEIDTTQVFQAIDSLVGKSMVVTWPIGAMVRYRLLDTTRAYALETSAKGAELADVAVRHAIYYQRWLEQWGTQWPSLRTGIERAPHFATINNARAALEWCFGVNGNIKVGVDLVCAAAPVFLAMTLLPECHRWSEKAISSLTGTDRGGHQEMKLQAALGVSLMFMRGGRDVAREALQKGLEIAENKGDALDQLRLLGPLAMFHRRTGEFKTALHYARRCSVIAGTVEDSTFTTLAHCILGISLHLGGEHDLARAELEAAVRPGPRSERTTTIFLGVEGRSLASGVLARTLWLQGRPDQATERARLTIEDAAGMDHPLTLCIALMYGISVFLWTGDLESAEGHIDALISCAESHSMAPYVAVGSGFNAELAIRRGAPEGAIETLRFRLDELNSMPYGLLSTPLTIALVQGLAAVGRFVEGLRLIDETIQLTEANGELCYMSELLRVKGCILLSMTQDRHDDAEAYFAQSLELSRRQGALAWELRTTTDLAKLMASRGQSEKARALLRPVFEQFIEGSDTVDVKAAERLLSALS